MTDDTTWTLHVETESGSDAIVASALEAGTSTPTDGATIFRTIAFYPDQLVSEPFYERYRALWPYTEVNHEAVVRTGTDDTGVPWFRERYGDEPVVESLVMGVEPGPGVIDERGWWGVLTGLTDASDPVDEANGVRLYQAEWFVLARYADYADHSAVREAFADEVI